MKRSNLFSLFIVLFFPVFVGNVCAQNGIEVEASLANANIRLVKDFTNAIVNKNFDAMENLLHKDYMGYGPYVATRRNKMEEIAEWRRVWGERVLHAEYNRTQILAINIEEGENAGHWVLDYAVVKARYAISPNTDVTFLFHAAHKIVNNQIIESHNYFNADDVRQQLGL